MKIIFTCGGTAGHINPAVALARMFQEREGADILFVGAAGAMETRLVPKEGFALRTVNVNSFRRTLKWSSVTHDIKAFRNIFRSDHQARKILEEFQPDLVVGTGGFASYPVVHAAARAGIPTAIHESNAVPGLTTRALAKVADRVMVGFAESKQYYEHPERVTVTGTPVRGDFFRYTREEARRKLGITDDRPLLLSYWGSLGAEDMDDVMAELICMEQRNGTPFHHIHGAGRDYDRLTQAVKDGGGSPAQAGVELREYIYDMPLVMAAADLVLCRSGASTVSELAAAAKPSVLVPSPNVTADHQTKNARVLERAGGAVLLPEAECSAQRLYEVICELMNDSDKRREMARRLTELSVSDANERIYQTLLSLLR